ncbi:hypothetical protein SAY87_019136 [Trapa incisa]|uniref:Uncharacterized protein n=1 Tax=Trapa incisa TaxID=236973 RepID=A0AAN7Q6T4_9MYRT|nr:hypothetical protein SAY87_019136 [Trapa incisa]
MILLGREDLQFLEESAIGDEPNTTPASTSSQYYTVEEVTLSIPDMDPDAAHSSDLQIQFSQGIETCSDTDYCNSDNLLDISLLELGKESSVVPFHDIGGQHGMDSDASYYTIPSGVLGIDSDQKNHILMSDGECFRTLFSDLIGPDSLAFCEQPYLSNQSVDIQIPASCVSISQPYDSSRSDLVAASGGQSSMPSTILSYNAEKINSGGKENQLLSAVGREGSVNPDDGIVFVNESANTLQDNCIELGSVEMLDLPKDEPKLIPVDTFGSSSGATQSCSKEDMKEDSGFLCYEPPRFLSLDIPLFSCDLIQSSNDTQMDYSPLGIRQLMTSSMNCFSPCRLWDSPTYDSSPEALLKNAAKTFRNTPSILRKRHREILSPLSDRRGISKKLGTNIISNFSQNISELDFLSDKAIDRPTTALLSDSNVDNKENLAIPFEARENMNDGTAVSSERNQVKDNERSGSEVKMDKGIDNNYLKCNLYAEADASTKAVQLSPRILLSFSSCQTSQKTVEALGATDGTSGNSCPPTSSPPPVSRSSGSTQKIASASRICLHTSSPLEILVNNASNDSLSVFGGTPFLRNIESPSAWKSPSFFNSFLPGPRIDTDITIEDIGYFISPGERSYDALGLMKHVSEHSASAFASAEEVLGNETPKQTTINVGNLDQQNKKSDQQTRTTTKASKALMERRTLDFSECVTPGKPKEKGKSSSIAMSFSSPSSYLLKGCR